jgi:Methylmalonyl-CoA mutase
MSSSIFTQDFDVLSQEDWLKLIQKSLKDKTLTDLMTQIEGIETNPFASLHLPAAVHVNLENNHWQIGEDFDNMSNKQILASLQMGTQALRLTGNPVEASFAGVEFAYISAHWRLDDTEINRALWAKMPSTGTVDWGHDDAEQALLDAVDCPANQKSLRIAANDLSVAIKQAQDYLNRADELGFLTTQEIANRMYFELALGDNFLFEISKIRALHHLWANLQAAWGVKKPSRAYILVTNDTKTFELEAAKNMIRATTQCLAAVIGGVEVFFVVPASDDQDAHRRIARNVQHLLQFEGQVQHVADPLAGSYYIEDLTRKMVEKAWF